MVFRPKFRTLTSLPLLMSALWKCVKLFVKTIIVFLLNFLVVMRAKMSIAHEKEMHLGRNGVYPCVERLPYPYCCFRIMHIRTGTIWIAYCEIMWIVSQFSFWTAESVVKQAFPPYIIIIGFVFTFIQLVLTGYLIQGTKKFKLSYIEVYMIGVCCRIFLFLSFFVAFLYFLLTTGEDDRKISDQFFHRFLLIKLIFTAVYTLLKVYALYTAYRCYMYIAKTKKALRHMTQCDKLESHVQLCSNSHCTLHSFLPSSDKCRFYGCRICNSSSSAECRDVLGKSCTSKQVPEVSNVQCTAIDGTGGEEAL